MRPPYKDLMRLAGLLACVALATSRLGLVAHELVGHGGVALVVGARVTDVQLFWFAGGWIRYQGVTSSGAALAIAMGGIAVELAIGIALWVAVGGGSLGRRIVRGIAAALVVHGAWYLATGAWHGYGDGVLLYRELGAARAPVAIAAGLIACASAFVGAREVLGALAATLPRQRVAGTIIAAVLAGGVHVALAASELALRRDATYAATMQPERARVVDRELATWAAQQAARGVVVSREARSAEQARLDEEQRTFPFAWLLGAAIVASAIAGAWRTRAGPAGPITPRLLAISGAMAALAIGLVITVGAWL